MMKWHRIFLLGAASLLGCPLLLTAQESVTGIVAGINESNQTLTVETLRPPPGIPGRIELQVGRQARLHGFGALDELRVGDEIKFTGRREAANRWRATQVEVPAFSGAEAPPSYEAQSPVADFLQSIKEQIQQTWYSLRYNLEPDRPLYTSQAETRLSLLEEWASLLRQKFNETPPAAQTEEIEKSVRDIRESLSQARRNLAVLQDFEFDESGNIVRAPEEFLRELAEDPAEADLLRRTKRFWDRVKSDFDRNMNKAREQMKQTGRFLLPERENYIKDIEYRLREMRLNQAQLESVFGEIRAMEGVRGDAAGDLDRQTKDIEMSLNILRERQETAETRLEALKSADDGDWRDMKLSLDEAMSDLQNAYYKALARAA